MAESNSWTENWTKAQEELWKTWAEMGRKAAQSGKPQPPEWMKSQEGFWQTWTEMGRQALGKDMSASAFWGNGLKQWWDILSASAAPTPAQDLYEKMLGTGRSYFSMAEQFSKFAGQKDDALEGMNNWLELAQKYFSQLAQGITPKNSDEKIKDFMNFWDLPLENWERTASVMLPMPGDFTRAFHPETSTDSIGYTREHLNRFLSIPAVGHHRESQEQVQLLMQQMLEYEAAMQAFSTAFAKVAGKSLQGFQQKLNGMTQSEQKIDSMRQLYDIWVDVCEEGHAEFVASEEYQKLYGDMTNSLMRVKRQMGIMVDEVLETLNIPTQAEIDTLQKRQQERRRENWAMRSEIESLRSDIEELKAKVASSAAAPKATGTKAPRVTSSIAKKTTSTIRKKVTKKRPVKAPATRKAAKTRATAAKR